MPVPFSILRSAVVLALGVALWASSGRTAFGESEATSELKVESVAVGIQGLHEVGRWTPVAVRIQMPVPRKVRLTIEATDPEGSVATFPSEMFEPATGGPHVLHGLFQQGRLTQGRLWVGIEDETGRRLFRGEVGHDVRGLALPPLHPGTTLVATLGNPGGFDAAEEQVAAQSGDRRRIALDDPAALPPTVDGWEALDVVVIARSFELGPERGAALRQWVRGGGHLVVSVGGNAAEYRRSSLAEWLPMDVADEPVRLSELSSLEIFADARTRLTAPAGISTARIGRFDGEAIVPGAEGPLLVRAPYGFGKVTFLAIDVAEPVVAGWEALPTVIRRILERKRAEPAATPATRRGGRLGHTGIGDLATQLRASLDHFPEVRRFSLWGVMGLLLLYLLVIGPADYLLVNHVLKRPRWTWATFPLIVLGGALLAVWGAAATNGGALRANRLAVVDLDVASGAVRGRSWATVFSPETRRYPIDLPTVSLREVSRDDDSPRSSRLVWSGVPEAVVGGMYRTGGFDLVRPPYRFSPEARSVQDLPIATWGTRTLASRWHGEAAGTVESDLRDAGLRQLDGTFAHHLPGPLEDWLLAFGNRVFYAGGGATAALHPGEVVRPGAASIGQRELRGHLTRTETVETQDRLITQQAAYDPLDRDPVSIARMLTFHRAAGGSEYTGLANQLLGDLELTDALEAGRAVLFGRLRVSQPPTRIDGAPVRDEAQTIIVRIVIPVARRDTADAADSPPSSRSTALAKARP